MVSTPSITSFFSPRRASSSNPDPARKSQSPLTSYVSTLRLRYPQADAPSLVASFLILHELSAVIPLFLGFWGFKSLDLGNSVVNWILYREPWFPTRDGGPTWLQVSGRRWAHLGEEQAERIGRRYGVLGFEKESNPLYSIGTTISESDCYPIQVSA